MEKVSDNASRKVYPATNGIDAANSSTNKSSNGIWASIKSVINKYVCCLYPFYNRKSNPASSEYLNKPIHDKILAAKTLEQRNALLIDSCQELSTQDKLNYQRLNALGTAILTHKDYLGLNGRGVFRVPGNASITNKKFKQVSQLAPDTKKFLAVDKLELSTLTSVYKLLASQLLKEAHDASLSSNFEDRLDAIKNKEAITQQIKQYAIPKDKASTILDNTNNRIARSLEYTKKPSLALQLITRLCAEVAKHKDIHQMNATNLSIVFAPHLVDSVKSGNNGLKQLTLQDEFALIGLSRNYISTLINKEKA